MLQAPVFLPKISMKRPVLCLADTLLLSGYLKAEELQALTEAWSNLITLLNPDLLLMDYSPTAALAASNLSCRTIMVGNSFWQPVPGNPIRSWLLDQSQVELTQRQEQMAVNTINQVLKARAAAPIQYLGDLFTVDRTIITTPPEFDLYGDIRQDALYHCKSGAPGIQKPVEFGTGSQPRVLAYLKPGHPQFDLIIKGLSLSDANVYVTCPQADPKRLEPLRSEQFNFSVQPVQLASAMAQAALFISHGNGGSTLESILAGTPVLSLPIQLEQLLTSQTVNQLHIGETITKVESPQHIANTVNRMLASKDLKKQTVDYAQRSADLTRISLGEFVADHCEQIMRTADAG